MIKNISITKSLIAQSVTSSLKIHNYVLIGIGNTLKIFDITEKKRESAFDVFVASSIHGIKKWLEKETNGINLLVYGQKSITIIQIDKITLSCKIILQEQQLEDWIIDATNECDESIVILTAHNKTLKLMLPPLCFENVTHHQNEYISNSTSSSDKSNGTSVVGESCENSLLYSGVICRTSYNCFVIMGGTAFGSINIWGSWLAPLENEKIKPLHILSGPKGTIFSLSYDEDLKLLSSTSDDRSVRLWKISCKLTDVDHQHFWEHSEIVQVFSSYGHVSRVWKSHILKDQTVLSCGEDSLICHWSGKGNLLSRWKAHSGTSIWSIDSDDNIVFTGGGDGSIKIWSLNYESEYFKIDLPLTNSAISIPNMKLKNNFTSGQDFPRAINLISSTSAVIVSNSGCVQLWKDPEPDWKLLYENSLLKGYVVTSINEHSTLLALGTLSGCVFILNIVTGKCVSKTDVSSSKIQSLIFAGKDLLTCSAGIIHMWTFEHQDVNGHLQLIREHHLPICRHHWVTAFTNCGRSISKEEGSFVAGDPSGSLLLFIPKKKEPVCTLKGLHGNQGVSSVNYSKYLIITSGRDGHIRFLSIVGFELIVVYDLKITYGSWICGIIQWGHHFIVPIFSGTKLQFWNVSKDQLICELDCGGGHRSWDIFIGEKRFQSSGKLQNFYQNKISSRLCYSYLKDGLPSIQMSKFQDKLVSELLTPISGKEIQCLIPLWTHGDRSIICFGGEDTLLHLQFVYKNKIYRIKAIKNHLSSIRAVVKLEDYSSMFGQNACKLNNRKEIFILSSGGRAQIKVWKFLLTAEGENCIYGESFEENVGTENFSLNCCLMSDSATLSNKINSVYDVMDPEYYSSLLEPLVFCQEVGSHMLKTESQHHWKGRNLAYDPETRYMDSIAIWITAHIVLFILASSDGFLRFFKYSVGGEFELVHSEDCSFCLLKLCIVKIQQHLILIASTTRGNLIFWDLKNCVDLVVNDQFDVKDDVNYKQLKSFQLCSSGINSLSLNQSDSLTVGLTDNTECDSVSIAAGCDSGEIFLTNIKIELMKPNSSQNTKLSVNVEVICCYTRHAAQVSGLSWIANDFLCSVSIDQRLIIWKLDKVNTDCKMTPIKVAFISVPDVQGLYLLPKNESSCGNIKKVCVFGSGLQIFDIEINNI